MDRLRDHQRLMPNVHATKPKAVRLPGGLEARVKAVLADGETVNALIVGAIEAEAERREGGSTKPTAGKRRGSTTTRKPREAPADKQEPESASDIIAALRRRRQGGQ